jgi:16S rRNA (guanine966-N2)-methyltransferase
VRVIAGEKGGRRLVAPEGRRTRPTSDRVREAAFSMLESFLAADQGDLQGADVWDLFAGSGALGIEALSRGASHATFVDNARSAVSAMTANLARLGYGATRASVVQADVLRWAHGLDAPGPAAGPVPGSATGPVPRRGLAPAAAGGRRPFGAHVDVVLADPPYDWEPWPALLGPLAPLGPIVVMETASGQELPIGWQVLRARRYGGTLVTLTRFEAHDNGPGRAPGGPAHDGPGRSR